MVSRSTPLYRLYLAFPSYDRAAIADVYKDCGYNEAKTRHLLGGRNSHFQATVTYEHQRFAQHNGNGHGHGNRNWKCSNCKFSNHPLMRHYCEHCNAKREETASYSPVHRKSYSNKRTYVKDQYKYTQETNVRHQHRKPQQQNMNMNMDNDYCSKHGHQYTVSKSGHMSHSFERKKSHQQSSNSDTSAKVGFGFIGGKYNRTTSSSSSSYDNRSAKIECKDVDSGIFCV
eukprot:UN12757